MSHDFIKGEQFTPSNFSGLYNMEWGEGAGDEDPAEAWKGEEPKPVERALVIKFAPHGDVLEDLNVMLDIEQGRKLYESLQRFFNKFDK